MRTDKYLMSNDKCRWRRVANLLCIACLLLATSVASAQTQTPAPDFQSVIARQASLVTEFDVNGLKVLVKKREGSATVAAGLFIRGGVENITPANAGIEAFMLNVATEASASYPRDQMRRDLARFGTSIGGSVNYDYSV